MQSRLFTSPVIAFSMSLALSVAAFSSQRCLANAYEGFVYPSSLPLNGLSGGVGWSIAWIADVPASTGFFSLAHASAKPSLGVAARTNLDAVCIRRLDPATGDIDAVTRDWMSFLFERDSNTSMVLEMFGLGVDPLYITIFPPGGVSLQYGIAPPAFSTSLASGSFITDFYLIRLTTTSVDLWVNPVAPLGAPHASVPVPPIINYSVLNFHMEIAQTLDEIRTGPTLGSVSALSPPCPSDVSPNPGGDGFTDISDLLFVISNWGGGAGNPADVNGDGVVNIADLLAIIGAWGACP